MMRFCAVLAMLPFLFCELPVAHGKAGAFASRGEASLMASAASLAVLEQSIERYQAIVNRGGWAAIPTGEPLRLGSRGQRVPLLRRRLSATGDLEPGDLASDHFDQALDRAVKRFQKRHGLLALGAVYGRTLAALNVPAQDRLVQLRANRDRLKEVLSQQPAQRYVLVNIPAYKAQIIENNQVAFESPVIVGRRATPTPALSAHMRAINFRPYWHIPDSVVERRLIPNMLKDPDFLKKERIRVYRRWREVDPASLDWTSIRSKRYLFRQDPGGHNRLGLIRFDMPNRDNIYMHDTPRQLDFLANVRMGSAGCVRIRRPRQLAKWLLKGEPGVADIPVDEIVTAQERRTVRLKRQVPVHLVYLTAWGDGEATVHFREDIYGHDGLGGRAADYGPVDPPLESLQASAAID